VASVDETLSNDDYDEFALLHENAAEWDLPFDDPPVVARHRFERADGQGVSYLRWGDGEPELVLLHGGAQNAHTWDTVLLALGRPAVSIDLPGHGHSDRRPDRNYGPWRNAEAVAEVLDAVAPRAVAVVGMSLGGATTIRLASARPDLCRRVVIVDVTPQTGDSFQNMSTVDQGSVALVAGPPTYDTFEEMAQAAIALSPFRVASGVRRGVRHNAMRRDDGRWTWRYDLFGPRTEDAAWADELTSLWDDVGRITAPVLLVRGGESKFVEDEDVDELRRRLPDARVEVVAGAGHAVQSDRPLELVRLIREFTAAQLEP
jgi:pimeloyl-ACP methyl ester carboxylesterase